MAVRIYNQGETTSYPTDISMTMTSQLYSGPTASTRCILFCHGRGGSGEQVSQNPVEFHSTPLANKGYVLRGIDHAKVNSWGDADTMWALDEEYAFITGTGAGQLGITNVKIGLMAWSMGGTTALNWAKRNPTKVACVLLFNPATDLRWWEQTAYTPPYSTTGFTSGAFQSEIDTTYAPSTNAVGTYTIPVNTDPTGITITVTTGSGKSFADGHNSGVVGLPRAIVNGVQFTYTGKTANTLTGCKSTTGSTIAVANNAAITTTGLFLYQSAGYRPYEEPASYTVAGLGGATFPIKVVEASDDNVVPPQMNLDATNGFVGKVNAAGTSNVTLRSPAPTGGHTNSISSLPPQETIDFFDTYLAV